MEHIIIGGLILLLALWVWDSLGPDDDRSILDRELDAHKRWIDYNDRGDNQ